MSDYSNFVMNDNQRISYLQWACNKFGDFKVATSYPDGRWSKHYSVMEIWHSGEFWRLAQANHRTLFNNELVLDVDPIKGEKEGHIYKRFKSILERLNDEGYEYTAYFTGSRGYHIHMFFDELALFSKYKREKTREYILKEYHCDLMKKGDAMMIAMEFTKHWKSGKPKTTIIHKGNKLPYPIDMWGGYDE